MQISGLNHVTLSVSDVERSSAFYSDVLGFRLAAIWPGGAYLEAGSLWLALVGKPGYQRSANEDYSHFALTCDEHSFDALCAKIRDAGMEEWSTNKSEGASYYFCDPDGHQLEIHVGDLDTRLAEMRVNKWADFRFFPRGEDRN